MKNYLKKLEGVKEKLSEKADQREYYFDDRTEKWQDSEKGSDYQEKTDQLIACCDNLDFAISELESYLE